jgi:hypothetical protein
VRQLIERLGSELMELAQLAYNKPYAEFAKRSLANGFRRAPGASISAAMSTT